MSGNRARRGHGAHGRQLLDARNFWFRKTVKHRFAKRVGLLRERTDHDSAASPSANSEQHGDVLAHLREQRWLGFGMELCLAACPVHAFELVD
jgi:hypothetical protein